MWQASWSVKTLVLAIQSFMTAPAEGAIGALDASSSERRNLACLSHCFKCPVCGIVHSTLACDEKFALVSSHSPTITLPPGISTALKGEKKTQNFPKDHQQPQIQSLISEKKLNEKMSSGHTEGTQKMENQNPVSTKQINKQVLVPRKIEKENQNKLLTMVNSLIVFVSILIFFFISSSFLPNLFAD